MPILGIVITARKTAGKASAMGTIIGGLIALRFLIWFSRSSLRPGDQAGRCVPVNCRHSFGQGAGSDATAAS